MIDPAGPIPRTLSRRLLFWRVLALLCAAVIFILSSASFNSSETLQVLRRILGLFHLSLAPAALDLLNRVIRKLAHLTEYAIFSLLVYRCFRAAHLPGWHPRPALWALAVAALYSLTDEFHQSFVPGRTPAWTDCGIDTAGAALAMFALYVQQRCRPMSADATPQDGDP